VPLPDVRLDTPLLQLSENPSDAWTVNHSFQGTQVFGATGSGKTTGSGQAIARALLRAGYGGLVLTAKGDERGHWEKYFELEKRPDRLVIVEPGGGRYLNFLDYLQRLYADGNGGGLTQNLVALFMTGIASGGGRGGAGDAYWDDALRQLLTHAVDLVALAGTPGGQVTLGDIAAVVRSAPQSRSEVHSGEWRRHSKCWQFLLQAEARFDAMRPSERALAAESWLDLTDTRDYWLLDFAGLADKTRSVIVSSFTAKATGLLRSPLRALFCDKTTVTPEETFEGKVILLNLPVKEYGEVGRVAQVLFKTVWQRAVESARRDKNSPNARPVFLWADESQYFVTSDDALFQQTARAKGAATVYLTQNLPSYHAVLDGSGRSSVTESLLGNLQTKIFHANGDPTTNEWAERVFGYRGKDRFAPTTSPQGPGGSIHHQAEPVVRASRFTILRKGGEADGAQDKHGGQVEAVAFAGGRVWRSSAAELTAIGFYVDQNTGRIVPRREALVPKVGGHDGRP
jgi:hypothetical protein